MEAKATKTKDGVLLTGTLPPEIAFAESVEIFPLRDGAFLVTVKGFVEKAKSGTLGITLSGQEIEVIRKLSAVRFERRTPAEAERILSAPERKVLSALVDRKMVTVFHSGKYGKEGVYNIVDAVYPIVRGAQAGGAETPAQAAHPTAAPGALQQAMPEPLAKKGWMVLDNETDARRLSDAASALVKSGEVLGIRSFDRKYYFVSKAYLDRWEKRILSSLAKGDKTADELSGELGMDNEGCRALLCNLCENGDLIEKQKGKFARA